MKLLCSFKANSTKLVPCHQGMARPRVADEGVGSRYGE